MSKVSTAVNVEKSKTVIISMKERKQRIVIQGQVLIRYNRRRVWENTYRNKLINQKAEGKAVELPKHHVPGQDRY